MSPEYSNQSSALAVAKRIAREFAALPQVEAVALAGSRVSEFADAGSDVDLYVYVTEDIPLDARTSMAASSPKAEIGNATWEPGDEWIDRETETPVDVMYRHVRWIEEQIDRVLVVHQASVGYSTCFWYNVLHSEKLYDRGSWFAGLQTSANCPYPDELRRAIIAKNYPLLRRNQSSYLHQIELAVKRRDPVSINHRVAAFLASYFDVLFAVNELPHPGEKRILQQVLASCTRVPTEMERQITELAGSAGRLDDGISGKVGAVVDELDELLVREGLVA